MPSRRTLITALGLAITPMAFAAAPVHEFTLDNGLKILVREDHRAPVVVSQIWYKVGSSYEPSGLTGISHLLEHLMFKGTPDVPGGEFSRLIAANGGDQNAFTSRDFTAYFQTLEKDRLELSFRLEADRMRHLLLKPEDVTKEAQVVAGRAQQNPATRPAVGQNQPPFFLQSLRLVPGQPILMIEQHEMTVLAWMGAKEVADRGVVTLHPVEVGL